MSTMSASNDCGARRVCGFRSVAAANASVVKLVDQVVGGDGAFDQPAQAFSGVFVDDGHHLDRSSVGGGVELKVDRPHPIRSVGNWRAGRGACAYPAVVRCDNGPELACAAMADWASNRVAFSLWLNGYVESFNSRVRDECLINFFWSLTQARMIINDWKHEYNHQRSFLGLADLLCDVA